MDPNFTNRIVWFIISVAFKILYFIHDEFSMMHLKTESSFSYTNRCVITYVFGRNSEATFLSRKLVCKAFSQSINAFDNGEWSHTDLLRG